ncbi:MAG: hypothetical protein RIE59_17280 [Imperialibacter sp.]
MNKQLQYDLNNTRQLLTQALEEGLSYLQNINAAPTSAAKVTTDFAPLPTDGAGGSDALSEFRKRFKDLMVASAGPRCWGFVTGGTTPAAIMGDMLLPFSIRIPKPSKAMATSPASSNSKPSTC